MDEARDRILEVLVPMSEVTIEVEEKGVFALVKEGIKFGIINQNHEVFFVDKMGYFSQIEPQVAMNADAFLYEATKSYWRVTKKNHYKFDTDESILKSRLVFESEKSREAVIPSGVKGVKDEEPV